MVVVRGGTGGMVVAWWCGVVWAQGRCSRGPPLSPAHLGDLQLALERRQLALSALCRQALLLDGHHLAARRRQRRPQARHLRLALRQRRLLLPRRHQRRAVQLLLALRQLSLHTAQAATSALNVAGPWW